MEQHGPFDVYCLDYDDAQAQGGWFEAARIIRQQDPYSIAKTVLIHSANIEARAYYDIFPAAIHIQWYVLATMLDFQRISDSLIEEVVERSDITYTPQDLIKMVEGLQEGQ
ncbi:MAG: hypothetical protein GYB64_16110 [Chloroflexi bacterium]|nr:hypothetical protein [Chloroflexota bacterium]